MIYLKNIGSKAFGNLAAASSPSFSWSAIAQLSLNLPTPPVFGMNAFSHQHIFSVSVNAQRHEHAFRHGTASVIETGIGDVHARELADERLIFEKGLQAPLAGLGLVGSVGGVILAAGGDRVDNGGNEMVVTAAAEETDGVTGRAVAAGEPPDVTGQLDLAERCRYVERLPQA